MGGIGQLVLQCARAMGGGRIFAFDAADGRLETAKKMGASACFNTRGESFIGDFFDCTAGLGSPQVIEAVGFEETIKIAISLAKVCGRVGVIGTMHKPVTFAPDILYQVFSRRQLWLRGVWMSYSKGYPGAAWRLAARYLADGRIDIKPLLYEVATIEDAFLAISEFNEPGRVTGKIVIKM
jgi:threonine dehydrogenase-like Zn-dependent dehydrogenase